MIKVGFLVVSIFSMLHCLNSQQHISDFQTVPPGVQDTDFHLPSTHKFQSIIRKGDPLTAGGFLPGRCDFAGYIPIQGSSSNGFLGINSELAEGGVTILELELDKVIGKWLVKSSGAVDFSNVAGTTRNCSGTVTDWGTLITCEETTSADLNSDGYNDYGWAVEIDPQTRSIIDQDGGLNGGDKLWALGNFRHENAVVHSNGRTVYQGVDDAVGYLYKFVADIPGNLSKGQLYVYKGEKEGSGNWINIKNTTPEEQNTTLSQSAFVEATLFSGIEDVEIDPIDSGVYLAVKNENKVYRFVDEDPLTGGVVTNFETYVGGRSYSIDLGTSIVTEPWGTGNDNLAFDNEGNLWVTQDGGRNYIWLVRKGHTDTQHKVEIFARSPAGSEPTGITFSPDYKYLFMSIQHPNESNDISSQDDAFGEPESFDKDLTLVIARSENLNNNILTLSEKDFKLEDPLFFPNPAQHNVSLKTRERVYKEHVFIYDLLGKEHKFNFHQTPEELVFDVSGLPRGYYLIRIKLGNRWTDQSLLLN